MHKQLAKVDDPQPGQVWFVRDTDNQWYLTTVKSIKGLLANIEYVDGTPERLNIKRHANDITLAPDTVKLTKKTFTTKQVVTLTSTEHEDVDPDWLEVQHTDSTQADQLKYLKKMWAEYNKTLFHGKLTKPLFGLIRKTDNKVRGLGVWITYNDPAKDTLKVSPRVYLSGHDMFRTTLVHEMCHQYCSQVLDLPHEQHGKNWQSTMRMVGLDPARTVKVDTDVVFDDKEVVKRDVHLDFLVESLKKYGKVTNPEPGLVVTVLDTKAQEPITGVLACYAGRLKGQEVWAFVADRDGSNFRTIGVGGILHSKYKMASYLDVPEFADFEYKVKRVQAHYQRQLNPVRISDEPY